MEDFETILQQQQFEGGTATGVLDHEWVASFLHIINWHYYTHEKVQTIVWLSK